MAATTNFRAGDTEKNAHGARWNEGCRAGTQTARPLRAVRVFALLVFCLFPAVGPVQAATTWTVDSTADAATGSGTSGTLRWVIGQASDGDTIQFAASLDGQTITLDTPVIAIKDLHFVAPNGTAVTVTGDAANTGGLLRDSDTAPAGMAWTFSGDLKFSGGTVAAVEHGGDTPVAAMAFGGGLTGLEIPVLEGEISNNTVTASHTAGVYAQASGGGVAVGGAIGDPTGGIIGELSATVSNNTASATMTGTDPNASGSAQAGGGGVEANVITRFSGRVENNRAMAEGGFVNVQGGGIYVGTLVDTLTGTVSGNLARGTSSTAAVRVYGGGVYAPELITLAGTVSGNRLEVNSASDIRAKAFGGGIYTDGAVHVAGGEYTDNQIVLTSPAGASLYGNTYGGRNVGGGGLYAHSVLLDPTLGPITFSGNRITVKRDEEDPGRTTYNGIALYDALTGGGGTQGSITIQDSMDTGHVITVADGIIINNDSVLNQTGGIFRWGGTNILRGNTFDGSGINFTGGLTSLMDGFTLSSGAPMLVSGDGHLRTEGGAVIGSRLTVADGGTLTVDLGSTLTLGDYHILALDNGTLSFGVGAGNTSGLIDMTANTYAAPTFSGSNTLDISQWLPGAYTVLRAGVDMDPGVIGTFQTFTVGGNAIDPLTMNLGAALANNGKDLQITAALNQNSAEKTWGGASGTWNYTNTNWLPGPSQFVLGDLAKFDGTGAGNPASPLAVTVGAGAGSQVETSGMSITGGSYTFSGGTIVGRTGISEGTAITPTGRLDIAGTGNIVFDNAVDFSGGLKVTPDSSVNISLADYTGGRVDLSGIGSYSGIFSGKLNIEGQYRSGDWGFDGGGLHTALSGSGRVSILDGSLIAGNSLDARNDSAQAYANGGGVYVFHNDLNAVAMPTLGGEISGNTASATVTAATGAGAATAEGGGAYVRGDVTTLSGKLNDNTAAATATANSGSARAHGGGAYIVGNLATLSGETSGNTAVSIQSASGAAYAYGGGTYVHYTLDMLSGEASGNTATATADAANVYVNGGGVYVGGTFGTLSGKVLDNTAEGRSVSRNAYANGGGLYLLKDAGDLGGEIRGNRAAATVTAATDYYAAYAYGGGMFAQKNVTALSGIISGNTAEGTVQSGLGYAHVYGGGAYVMESLGTLSGTVSGNAAKARNDINDIYDAYAHGGGAYVYKSITALSGTVSGNTAEAQAVGGSANAFGGGVNSNENITALSGQLSGNTAKAASSSGDAYARGGGAYVTGNIADLSGTIINNTAEAVAGGSGQARAQGGGLFVSNSDILISEGTYSGNKAIAVGSGARAQGGAIFLGADGASSKLVLDPTAGAITFSGNTVTTKANAGDSGATTANAIHFGRSGNSNASADAYLNIQDSADTGNLITIADGITTDLNNGKGFIMKQLGGEFLWGGPNKLDSANSNFIHLYGGVTRLMDGFSLERGALNGDSQYIVLDVSGGSLVSEGASASLKDTALYVASSGKLTVDLGSTLTLDANSIFYMDSGILSFGVGAGNASGKIDMTANTTDAPTFTGSNTLDISHWIPGVYTVLQAGKAMAAAALDTFTAFTVGGNAIDPQTMDISVSLANGDKDLQVNARLSRDNQELVWGGTSGSWNYTDQNWLDGGGASLFLPGDAALFDSVSGAHAITLGGTAVSLSGMKVAGGADYTLSGAALRIDAGSAENLPGSVDYADNLVMDGTGTLLLNTGGTANPNLIAGDVRLTDGRTIFADGFNLANNDYTGVVSVGADGKSPVLEIRGASELTGMTLSLVWDGPSLEFTRPDSSLTIRGTGTSYLGQGTVAVDLNRPFDLPVFAVIDGNTLELGDPVSNSVLSLTHSGLASQSGQWLIVDGPYSNEFGRVDIGTATLSGELLYDIDRVLFDGSYTVAGSDFPGYSSLSPNARRAWTGFRDALYNGRTPFMNALDLAYGSPAAFQADLARMLPYASAEGAVSQGIQALSAHNAAAMAAFGYAFGSDTLESSQGFAPLAFQAPNTLGFNIGSQNRREQARLTGRYVDRMASLDGNFGYGHSVYSVLGNWRPATDETRNLVAQASPEYALNAAANPNTPFGARVWGGYLGNFAHQDNRGGYAGYNADQNGFLIGASLDLTPNWTVGAYAGWTTGETRYSGISTRVDTDATHVGAFARYRREAGPGTVKVTGDILYSYTDNDSRRTVPTIFGDQRMKGSFDQNIWGGGLELAYDWRPESDPATVLTPYIAGRYAHLDQDGFSESGNLGLKIGGTDADSFTTTLGFKAARDFAVGESLVLTPKVTLGWLHQWADRDIAANSNFIGSPVTFMTRSVKQDADAALAGAGLDVLIKTGQSWDLGLKIGYGADIRKNGNDQTVFAGFEVRF